jgi:hypothetical protein
VNGGRAEPKTEAMRSESVLAAQSTSLTSNDGGEVDVPRFELGNRNAERIRCFILGFQVAERLAAWNNNRYGGGL